MLQKNLKEEVLPFELMLRDSHNVLTRGFIIGDCNPIGIYINGVLWWLKKLPVSGFLPEEFLSDIRNMTGLNFRYATQDDYKVFEDKELKEKLDEFIEHLINEGISASRFKDYEVAEIKEFTEKYAKSVKSIRLILDDTDL